MAEKTNARYSIESPDGDADIIWGRPIASESRPTRVRMSDEYKLNKLQKTKVASRILCTHTMLSAGLAAYGQHTTQPVLDRRTRQGQTHPVVTSKPPMAPWRRRDTMVLHRKYDVLQSMITIKSYRRHIANLNTSATGNDKYELSAAGKKYNKSHDHEAPARPLPTPALNIARQPGIREVLGRYHANTGRMIKLEVPHVQSYFPASVHYEVPCQHQSATTQEIDASHSDDSSYSLDWVNYKIPEHLRRCERPLDVPRLDLSCFHDNDEVKKAEPKQFAPHPPLNKPSGKIGVVVSSSDSEDSSYGLEWVNFKIPVALRRCTRPLDVPRLDLSCFRDKNDGTKSETNHFAPHPPLVHKREDQTGIYSCSDSSSDSDDDISGPHRSIYLKVTPNKSAFMSVVSPKLLHLSYSHDNGSNIKAAQLTYTAAKPIYEDIADSSDISTSSDSSGEILCPKYCFNVKSPSKNSGHLMPNDASAAAAAAAYCVDTSSSDSEDGVHVPMAWVNYKIPTERRACVRPPWVPPLDISFLYDDEKRKGKLDKIKTKFSMYRQKKSKKNKKYCVDTSGSDSEDGVHVPMAWVNYKIPTERRACVRPPWVPPLDLSFLYDDEKRKGKLDKIKNKFSMYRQKKSKKNKKCKKIDNNVHVDKKPTNKSAAVKTNGVSTSCATDPGRELHASTNKTPYKKEKKIEKVDKLDTNDKKPTHKSVAGKTNGVSTSCATDPGGEVHTSTNKTHYKKEKKIGKVDKLDTNDKKPTHTSVAGKTNGVSTSCATDPGREVHTSTHKTHYKKEKKIGKVDKLDTNDKKPTHKSVAGKTNGVSTSCATDPGGELHASTNKTHYKKEKQLEKVDKLDTNDKKPTHKSVAGKTNGVSTSCATDPGGEVHTSTNKTHYKKEKQIEKVDKLDTNDKKPTHKSVAGKTNGISTSCATVPGGEVHKSIYKAHNKKEKEIKKLDKLDTNGRKKPSKLLKAEKTDGVPTLYPSTGGQVPKSTDKTNHPKEKTAKKCNEHSLETKTDTPSELSQDSIAESQESYRDAAVGGNASDADFKGKKSGLKERLKSSKLGRIFFRKKNKYGAGEKVKDATKPTYISKSEEGQSHKSGNCIVNLITMCCCGK